jgi:predicted RNase H-like HicB family nuclease
MATRHYIGIVEPGSNNWSLSFPSFPGTVTVGDNFAELIRHGRDALSSIVEAVQDAGQDLPRSVEEDDGGKDYEPADYDDPRSVLIPVESRGASVRVNITIDDGLLARVDDLSRRIGGSRSALLARGARMVLAVEGGG